MFFCLLNCTQSLDYGHNSNSGAVYQGIDSYQSLLHPQALLDNFLSSTIGSPKSEILLLMLFIFLIGHGTFPLDFAGNKNKTE